MKIHFYLDRRKGRENSLPVFLQYWHEGELLRVFTGEHCDIDSWDKKAERISKNVPGADVTNELFASMEEEVVRIVREAKVIRETLSVKDIRQKLTFVSGAAKDFFKVWDEFVDFESTEKDWTAGTIKRIQVVKSHLIKMNRFYRINFQSINNNFYKNFLKYHADLGYKTTYARRNLDILKWFMNWAAEKGYRVNMEYRKIKPAKERVIADQVILNQKELARLAKYQSESKKSMLVKDVFLFGCMTGLGYSEISQLTRKDIQNGKIKYTPKKVSRSVEVPIVETARHIIDRYSNNENKHLFKLPPIQYYNVHLKKIGKESGLNEKVTIQYSIGDKIMEKSFRKWELLSSKVARKTFINIGAEKGIGLEVMSELSGYLPGTIRSFYKLKDKLIKNEITKLNEIYHTGHTSI